MILAFEGKDGLPLGFLRHLSGESRPKLVIMFFSVKGVIMHFLPLARYGMAGVDHIIVPTHAEIPYYSRLLGYPQERITFCPLGTYNPYGAVPPPAEDGPGYIFAGGRSERDYGTLLKAVDGLDVRLVVNARRFNLSRATGPTECAGQRPHADWGSSPACWPGRSLSWRRSRTRRTRRG